MIATIPLTINQEVVDFLAKSNLQQPFHIILDQIPMFFGGIQAMTVTLAAPYEVGDGPEVIIDAALCDPPADDDPTEENWRRWIIETFPPEVFTHFCVVPRFVRADVR